MCSKKVTQKLRFGDVIYFFLIQFPLVAEYFSLLTKVYCSIFLPRFTAIQFFLCLLSLLTGS